MSINIICSFLVVLFIFPTLIISFGEYCNLKPSHIVCERKSEKCKAGPKCGNDYKLPMTKSMRKMILHEHNKLRSKVATGQANGQPSAANMKQLVWDDELEYIAQCLANTCEFRHDQFRNVERFKVGQNVAWASSSERSLVQTEEKVRELVVDWYNEIKDTPAEIVDAYQSTSGAVIGHYTQLVWAEAEFLGCGVIYYGSHEVLLVCDYGGSVCGNTLGRPVYLRGEPCSKCDPGVKCGKYYDGLCGKAVSLTELGLNKHTIILNLLFLYLATKALL